MRLAYAEALRRGLVPSPARPAPPGLRVLGWDPGAPVSYYALLEAGEPGDFRVVELAARPWEDEAGAPEIYRGLFERLRPDVLLVEEQFLDPHLFFGEAARKRRLTPAAAGKLFADLRRLSIFVGQIELAWATWRAGHLTAAQRAIVEVPHGTWKAGLAPAKTHTRDFARGASLEFAALAAPGLGTGSRQGEGSWVDDDHDLAAALGIAMLGTGRTASSVAAARGFVWPGVSPLRAAAAKAKEKAAKTRAAKARPGTALDFGDGDGDGDGDGVGARPSGLRD